MVVNFIEFLQTFSSIVSEECSSTLIAFVCQHAFPPCDGDGSPLLLTQEQCINIRDDVCANEWRIIMATEHSLLLPFCEALENPSSSVTRNVSEPFKCHYHFKKYCGLCFPLCRTFPQYSEESIKFGTVTLIGYMSLSLSGAAILLIAVIVKRKTM